MDISNIITHLNNFVDTWESWAKIILNLPKAISYLGEVSSFASSK
ncbi:Uncharacterised protein [Corynebacterium kutscheri]|uniref:Uncharacterized protein n=1 Tax=Corynebacterium kutscheri TaxID=35755 RepID=A0A0F6R0Z0_9CORY|nr:hypothetical protein [Corynebacterium kutscheri]AKE40728.1 hypothetical protein UL82_02515 [Corynebacterium kutscheri]VEH04622.1 Uncharacterised protein [Corynebacterium kutscheri]VEH11125.1 Uncharacterised protein [Corynebacterium kutscheri]VEH80398.1 Uncharacterised protein [Corynebacterium kutscheri]